MFKIAVGQMEPRITDLKGNLSRMKALLKSASEQEVDAIVLPEFVNSSYAFKSHEELEAMSEKIPEGSFSKALMKWSKGGSMVVAGLSEKAPEGFYDSAVVFANGNHLATYRVIHLFHNKKKWFLSGNEEPPVVEYKGYKFGVIIGFDWAFPEITRVVALKGAQVVFHPTNLLLSYCHRAMITRSIENRIFTATASRVGTEREYSFIGGSQITDPRGHVLLRMDYEEEDIAWVDIEPAAADRKIIDKNEIWEDRKPELYGRITGNL
jgi:predicted amidohydrolase